MPLYYDAKNTYEYYKYGDADIKVSLSDSDNSTNITDGSFVTGRIYNKTLTQTYTLNSAIEDNVIRLNFSSTETQQNATWVVTVTAITDNGEIEVLNQDWGKGVMPIGDYEVTASTASKILGIKVNASISSTSSSYVYGNMTMSVYKRSILNGTADDYDYTVTIPPKPVKDLYLNTKTKYYKYVDIYGDWTQPVLTDNGTLGGESFAVYGTSYSSEYGYKAFDGKQNTVFTNNGNTGSLIFYSPIPLKASNLHIMNGYESGYVRPISSGVVSGSNDNNDWTVLKEFTNTLTGVKAEWDINLSDNEKAYKYYKIDMVGDGTSARITELTITAQELLRTETVESTSDDYDFTKIDGKIALGLLNNELVYCSYNATQTICDVSNGETWSGTLARGVYYIRAQGGGGGGGNYGYPYFNGNGGGSGAGFEGYINITSPIETTVTTGASVPNSTDGVDTVISNLVTLGGGGAGPQTGYETVDPAGAGGVISFVDSSDFYIMNATTINSNGKAGSHHKGGDSVLTNSGAGEGTGSATALGAGGGGTSSIGGVGGYGGAGECLIKLVGVY